MKELYTKIREALVSTLPITIIVYILALLPWFDVTGTELITFSVGAVFLIVGLGLFSLGADLAMTPMGNHVGAGLSKQRNLSLLLIASFMLGLNIQKAVIVSFVREDLVEDIMKCLETKFATIKNGKGIAFSLPVSDVAGLVPVEELKKEAE